MCQLHAYHCRRATIWGPGRHSLQEQQQRVINHVYSATANCNSEVSLSLPHEPESIVTLNVSAAVACTTNSSVNECGLHL